MKFKKAFLERLEARKAVKGLFPQSRKNMSSRSKKRVSCGRNCVDAGGWERRRGKATAFLGLGHTKDGSGTHGHWKHKDEEQVAGVPFWVGPILIKLECVKGICPEDGN